MKTTQSTPTEMDLTAAERELARTLASLSPTVTSGVASVPAKELALRAGAARSKQRLRNWQAGSVLVMASVAAAYVWQPGQSPSPRLASDTDSSVYERHVTIDDPKLAATIVESSRKLQGIDALSTGNMDGPLKVVAQMAGLNGEIIFRVVPKDWELCDH